MDIIKIGTRGSALALAQAHFIAGKVESLLGVKCEVVVIKTHGDIDQNSNLNSGNVTGFFTREIEQNLLDRKIDLAVHSLKDLPLLQPDGLRIVAYPSRENPADVLVYAPDARDSTDAIIPLKKKSVVGTGSPRRAAILKKLRPDLTTLPIRGNVDTRLNKVASGEFDATFLARAGLNRLKKTDENLIFADLPLDVFPCAPGQGALAIETREDFPRAGDIANALNDADTEQCVISERKLLRMFGGGCSLPLGVIVKRDGSKYTASGFFSEGEKSSYAHSVSDTADSCINELYNILNSSC